MVITNSQASVLLVLFRDEGSEWRVWYGGLTVGIAGFSSIAWCDSQRHAF